MWHHLVDQTNGWDPEDPTTCPAKLEVREYEDHWHEDHYGNKYATRNPLYKIPETGRIPAPTDIEPVLVSLRCSCGHEWQEPAKRYPDGLIIYDTEEGDVHCFGFHREVFSVVPKN